MAPFSRLPVTSRASSTGSPAASVTNSPHKSSNKTHQFHFSNHLLASLNTYLPSVCSRLSIELLGQPTAAGGWVQRSSPQLQEDGSKDPGHSGVDWPGSSSDFTSVLIPATQPTLTVRFLICTRKTKSLAGIVKTGEFQTLWGYRRVIVIYVNGHWSLAGKVDISKYKTNFQ